MRWDPTQYARYAGPRARPYVELVTRIDADAPARVVDLGCGPGDQTVTLRERWPEAEITGIDSSAEMIAQAPTDAGVAFRLGDANDFDASGLDVLLSNALLQWVPDHPALLARWASQINPDGWLALQVPDNFEEPSHRLLRELAESPRWADKLSGVLRSALSVKRPADYLELLTESGLEVHAWQTEYLHVLEGPDPVLEWVRGTAHLTQAVLPTCYGCRCMRTITHRQLRNSSAEVLRAVADGESFLVTNNGATVARLSPAIEGEPDLRVSRAAIRRGGFSKLPLHTASQSTAEILDDLRSDR
jgi:trans-aconitate 2-methyltransferase